MRINNEILTDLERDTGHPRINNNDSERNLYATRGPYD